MAAPTLAMGDGGLGNGRRGADKRMSFLNSSFGLLAVLALVLLNGFFVAAEFALVSVRHSRMEQLANEGSRSAQSVLRALSRLDTCIAGTQLGITMASLGLGSVGEPFVAHLIDPLFSRWLPAQGAAITSHAFALAIAFAIVTSFHIVLGELVPKSVAIQRSDRMALLLTGPLNLFLRIFRPAILALNMAGNFVLRAIGLQPVGEHTAVHSVDELELLVHSTAEAGLLEEQQERMVTGVFDFEDTVVRKLMTPRLDITAVEVNAGTEELIRVISESGHSRLPVYEGTLDNILGVIHAKDVLRSLARSRTVNVRELMHPAYVIPESKRAGYLLAEMRRSRTHMAIVQDEYGTVVGVVTIEDLLEEIVGEIQDEYDIEEPTLDILADNMALVDGRMALSDVNDRLVLELPEEEADTIGGFVFSLLGHQAEQGEHVSWENVEFTVEATDGRRITQVRLTWQPKVGEENAAPPAETQINRDGTTVLVTPPDLEAPREETPVRR